MSPASKSLDKKFLFDIADNNLTPLFSGASLKLIDNPPNRIRNFVSFSHPCKIRFTTSPDNNYQFELNRHQDFEQINQPGVKEINVVKAFVEVIREMEDGLQSEFYRDDLLSTFQRRIVAKAITENKKDEGVVLKAIDYLTLWASRLYEGKPITAALGFEPNRRDKETLLDEISKEDFGLVLSNGFDTLYSFNLLGRLLGHESLKHLKPEDASVFAPYRQAPIAEWAQNQKIAFALNRLGEIFVFKNKKLLFTRRGGKWHFLTHGSVIRQMSPPKDRKVRNAIYESCLDASFARNGGCIGVVLRENLERWQKLVKDDDELSTSISVKAKAINQIVKNRRFQDLDRRLRQELLAIDGATLLDYKGNILAVGAILKIPGGSTGGGRLAAAKTLSKLGLGIKVSQDGGIRGFKPGGKPSTKKPAFFVM
ncbi:MAG: hypothetical protein V1673_02840 [Candidatus Omnitrophota bacterium]